MNFQIKSNSESEWLDVGTWFDAFIDLGQKIHKAKMSGLELKRVLISLPQSEMVSLGLAIGFSRAAYLQENNYAIPIELEEIRLGEIIQIRAAWQQHSGKIYAPANIVGEVIKIDNSRSNEVKITLSFNSTGQTETRKIMKALCPSGEKDPLKNLRLFKVPRGTPQRPGKEPREFDNLKLTESQKQLWVKKWENWEYQIDPTLVIFGSKTKVADYGKPMFRDAELHGTFLQIHHDNLLNVARLDSLSTDTRPHFVNAIEQISSFPPAGSPPAESLSQFPFVCLDGNAAMVALCDRKTFDSKCLIGLWEMSKPNLQQLAISSFVDNASRYSPLSDFEEILDWRSPAGVQCWGWV